MSTVTRRNPPSERLRRLGEMLRTKRAELVAVLERQLGDRVEQDALGSQDGQIEIGDRSVTILGQDIELGVLEMRRRELRQIDEALVRLTAGTYGVCEECGAAIDEERLAILPFALQCVDCKRVKEAEEKRVEATGRGFRAGFRDVREGNTEDDGEKEED